MVRALVQQEFLYPVIDPRLGPSGPLFRCQPLSNTSRRVPTNIRLGLMLSWEKHNHTCGIKDFSVGCTILRNPTTLGSHGTHYPRTTNKMRCDFN